MIQIESPRSRKTSRGNWKSVDIKIHTKGYVFKNAKAYLENMTCSGEPCGSKFKAQLGWPGTSEAEQQSGRTVHGEDYILLLDYWEEESKLFFHSHNVYTGLRDMVLGGWGADLSTHTGIPAGEYEFDVFVMSDEGRSLTNRYHMSWDGKIDNLKFYFLK